MTYSALLVQRHGYPTNGNPGWERYAPTIRVPMVTGVTTIQDIAGGYQEGACTIPQQHVRCDVDTYRRGTLVWLFDGLHQAFYGHIAHAVQLVNGDITLTLDGASRRLDDTRMRSVWRDGDLSAMAQSVGSSRAWSATVDANGDLVLSLPSGVAFHAGDFIGVDYFLFGEPSGTRDTKKLDGWNLTLGGVSTTNSHANYGQNSNLELQIYGLDTPGASDYDVLQTFTAANQQRYEISDASSGQNVNAWPNSSGYRCFRVLLTATGDGTASKDFIAKITDFSVTTRGRALGQRTVSGSGNPVTTTQIAKDIWTQAAGYYDLSFELQEEDPTGKGLAVTGNITDPGQTADGVSFIPWSSPMEILEALQEIDAYRIGMWGPTKSPALGAKTTNAGDLTINPWYRQPPELVYEPWPDLNTPEYVVRLARGALWEPSGDPDDLVTALYANYSTRKGRSQSVFVEDTSVENRLWEQGKHRATDYTFDPPVAQSTAQSLANQYVHARRQPTLSGQLTVYGDRLGAIQLPGGARIAKLSQLRPGVLLIADAKGPQRGWITSITYTGRQYGQPEQAVLTVNYPASYRLLARLNRIQRREARNRHR